MRTIDQDDKNYLMTTIIYALQAVGIFSGGITLLVAVIMNYVKQQSVQGTFLASHFVWQIRTFWYCLFWGIIGYVTSFILIGFLILGINLIWMIYRVVKGWIYLYERKPMYQDYQQGGPGPRIINP